MHDEQVYSSPDKFQPERFLQHKRTVNDSDTSRINADDPTALVFGFGRR